MKHARVSKVSFSNRKKQLYVEYRGGVKIALHYGQVGIRKSLVNARPDAETSGRAIVLEYTDGATDYMPYDQPLAAAKDPDFMLRHDLEVLVARVRRRLKEKNISLRYLAERLETSDAQVQRLLNPAMLNKNLTQLYAIASIVGLEMEVRLKSAA